MQFHFVTVDDFSPCSPFSLAHFGKLKTTGVVKDVSTLFLLDEAQLQSNPIVKTFMDSIENIDVGSIADGPTERISFFSIAKTLLTVLGDEVCLNSTYKSLCKDSDKLKIGHMRIGSKDTLHGYPDSKIRALGSATHCMRPTIPDEDEPSSSSSESSGVHMYTEGKLTLAKINKHQLIATSLVTSFSLSIIGTRTSIR